MGNILSFKGTGIVWNIIGCLYTATASKGPGGRLGDY